MIMPWRPIAVEVSCTARGRERRKAGRSARQLLRTRVNPEERNFQRLLCCVQGFMVTDANSERLELYIIGFSASCGLKAMQPTASALMRD